MPPNYLRSRITTALAASFLLWGCRVFLPEGWAYVTGVTTTRATVVWTASRPQRIRCRGRSGTVFAPTTELRPRGLQFARLEGLKPASRYSCRIGSKDQGPYVRVQFHTAPGRDQPFTFAVVGDTGDASAQAKRLAQRILRDRPSFLIHLGDMAYSRSTAGHLDACFFRPYRRLLARVPLFPTPGNHDLTARSVYREVFAPINGGGEGAPLRYAFRWGGARFVSVPSPAFPQGGEAQRLWLTESLAKARPGLWSIVFLHEPPYGAAGKYVTRNLRAMLQPIVEAAYVDLVLAAHEHLYVRADPSCQYVPDASVLQIISGGGGAGLDRAESHPAFPRVLSATHYLRVHVTPEWLDIRAVDAAGQVLDWVRRRRGDARSCRSTGWPEPREKDREVR